MELAEADEPRRIDLVIGWSLASADDLEGVLREAAASGDDVTEQLESVARVRKDLEAYARRHNARTRRWRPDEKALAQKHDRGGYLDFRIAHHFVHGSTFAGAQRYSQEGDVVVIGGPAAHSSWGVPALLSAASSLVHATRAASTILGLEPPPGLDELEERIEAEGERLGLTRASGASG
jgi:hypothetical protein